MKTPEPLFIGHCCPCCGYYTPPPKLTPEGRAYYLNRALKLIQEQKDAEKQKAKL